VPSVFEVAGVEVARIIIPYEVMGLGETCMVNESSASGGFVPGALKDGFVRILGRVKRMKNYRDGMGHHDNVIDFILAEVEELEADLEVVARGIGIDLDMEAKNIREIESSLAGFIAKTFNVPEDQSFGIAHNFLIAEPDKPASSEAIAVSKAIVTVDVLYEQNDRSSWTRTIDIWHLINKKPMRFTADVIIPRDELPPDVREQSISLSQTKFKIRLYPSE